MDVLQVISEYKTQLKVIGYAQNTVSSYTRNLAFFEAYLQAHRVYDLRSITAKTIRHYQAAVMAEKNARETKALKLRVVKRLFEYLTDNHRLLINPTEGLIEVSRKNRKIGSVLSLEEIKRLLAVPDLSVPIPFRNRVIMEVFYATGIRHSELLNLLIEHINMEDTVLQIYKGKGNMDRRVPLGKHAASYLDRYIKEIRPLFAPKSSKVLFVNTRGGRLSMQSIYGFLRKYRRKADIAKYISPHTFRRTFATHMLQQGADIRYIQKMLGHKKLSTTQAYTKVLPVDVKHTHETTHPGHHFDIEEEHDH